MNKRKKSIKNMMLFLACIGALFVGLAVLLYLTKGNLAGIKFPRADIAHIGFAVVGSIYLISAAGLFLVIHSKEALIEEFDERSKTIEAKSGMIAFGVQTLLLFTCVVLLIFTGYLNVVSAFLLIGVLFSSIVVFVIAQIYLAKKI